MYGPSRWTAQISAPLGSCAARAIAATARWRSACDPESVVAAIAVVPLRAWNRVTRSAASSVASMKSAPSPPWTWTSMKPGTIAPPCTTSQSGGACGSSRTSAICEPSIVISVPSRSSPPTKARP